MNRFTAQMARSNADLRTQRAASAAATVEMEVGQLVNDLTRQKLDLQNKIEDLCDFGPDQTTSLRPAHRDFNAKKWVQEMSDAKLELIEVEVKLEVAKGILDEWFSPIAAPETKLPAPAAKVVDAQAADDDQTN